MTRHPDETRLDRKQKVVAAHESWLGRVIGTHSAPELRPAPEVPFAIPAARADVDRVVPQVYEENARTRYPVLHARRPKSLRLGYSIRRERVRLDDTAEEMIERGAIEPLIIVESTTRGATHP